MSSDPRLPCPDQDCRHFHPEGSPCIKLCDKCHIYHSTDFHTGRCTGWTNCMLCGSVGKSGNDMLGPCSWFCKTCLKDKSESELVNLALGRAPNAPRKPIVRLATASGKPESTPQ